MKTTALMQQEIDQLCSAARAVALSAHAPYSKFRVGAAILGKKGVYTGANVENASFGLSLCAERAALAKAVSEGEKNIRAMAIACIDAKIVNENIEEFLPCGACRQWMIELASNAEIIICGTDQIFRVEELIPMPFRLYNEKRTSTDG